MKGIKKLISLERTSDSVSAAVNENNVALTKTEDIVNAFNKYFINISSTIQFTIKFSRRTFYDFLPDIEILFSQSQLIKQRFKILFKISFGVTPSIRKSRQVILIFKKEAKLKCSTYCPTAFRSIISKILE